MPMGVCLVCNSSFMTGRAGEVDIYELLGACCNGHVIIILQEKLRNLPEGEERDKTIAAIEFYRKLK